MSADTITIRWGTKRYTYPCSAVSRVHVRRIYRGTRRVQMIASGGVRRYLDRDAAVDQAAHFLMVAEGTRCESSSKAADLDQGGDR